MNNDVDHPSSGSDFVLFTYLRRKQSKDQII